MHITLTGNLGSGKSTVSKLLEQQYGYEIFSTGKVIRSIADELGISVLEMNELMGKDHKYDKMIDRKTADLSRENPDRNILFDSRLAWHFVEKSFKVFLSVDLKEAARRVYLDQSRGEVEAYRDEEDAANKLAARAAAEDARYEELYGIHYFDFNNYNLVLDTGSLPAELIARILMEEFRKNGDGDERGRLLISPKRLLPGAPETDISEAKVIFPGTVGITVSGNTFTVTEGLEKVRQAAEQGYAYVCCRQV